MAVMLSPRANKNQDPQSIKLLCSSINGEDLSQIKVIYYETIKSGNITQLVQSAVRNIPGLSQEKLYTFGLR